MDAFANLQHQFSVLLNGWAFPWRISSMRRSIGHNIDFQVLDTIGKLSNRGDAKIGRHADRQDAPLTNDELRWLEDATFRLVKRIGVSASWMRCSQRFWIERSRGNCERGHASAIIEQFDPDIKR